MATCHSARLEILGNKMGDENQPDCYQLSSLQCFMYIILVETEKK